MAKIVAGFGTSHTPAIGAALDLGKSNEPYWRPLFAGYEFSRRWLERQRPDVIFLVYNDHATAFSLDLVPTFAIGTAAEFRPADEGGGARPVPKVPEWERIANEIKLVGEELANRRLSVDEAAAELDRRADAILEKRRWMLDHHTIGAAR